jgi:hypothetical protein
MWNLNSQLKQSFLMHIGKTKVTTKRLPKKAKLANIIKSTDKFRPSMYKIASEASAMIRIKTNTFLLRWGTEKPWTYFLGKRIPMNHFGTFNTLSCSEFSPNLETSSCVLGFFVLYIFLDSRVKTVSVKSAVKTSPYEPCKKSVNYH